jgi:hypothetical protein
MSTSGLTAVRELEPPGRFPFRQASTGRSWLPGKAGPITTADKTAAAPMTAALRSKAAGPPRDRLANHEDDSEARPAS